MVDVYFLEKKRIMIGETYSKRKGNNEKFYLKEGYLIKEMSKEDFEKNSKKILEKYLNTGKENKEFWKKEILSKRVINLEDFFE